MRILAFIRGIERFAIELFPNCLLDHAPRRYREVPFLA